MQCNIYLPLHYTDEENSSSSAKNENERKPLQTFTPNIILSYTGDITEDIEETGKEKVSLFIAKTKVENVIILSGTKEEPDESKRLSRFAANDIPSYTIDIHKENSEEMKENVSLFIGKEIVQSIIIVSDSDQPVCNDRLQ